MASLKLPEIVPSPNTDTERLRNAFQGFSLFLFLSLMLMKVLKKKLFFFNDFKYFLNLGSENYVKKAEIL